MVGLKATLLDGSYHPVDSSEMAFFMAAKLAYKAAMPEAGPVILEPIHTLKAHVPNDNTGDIMGDLNKRRGRVLGMNPCEEGTEVVAEAPLSEKFKYATDLRSMTQARGSFTSSSYATRTSPLSRQRRSSRTPRRKRTRKNNLLRTHRSKQQSLEI